MLKIRKIKKREWLLFSVSFIIIFAVLMDNAARKTLVNFSRMEEEITLDEKTLFRLKSILNQADELNAGYEKVLSRYKVLKDSDNLLQDIERLARRSNVNILNIKPAVTKDEGAYKTYSIKIESQDDVPTFAKFLYSLTEELKGIGVDRLQINLQNREELPRLTLLLEAIVFKE